jgi:hypothetical protein
MLKVFKYKGEFWKGFEFKGKFYLVERIQAAFQKDAVSV